MTFFPGGGKGPEPDLLDRGEGEEARQGGGGGGGGMDRPQDCQNTNTITIRITQASCFYFALLLDSAVLLLLVSRIHFGLKGIVSCKI
jgi:hypothetical protein